VTPPNELKPRTVRHRLRSFDDIPAEVKILTISYVDLDPATSSSLSLLNREGHHFLKTYEVELVKNIVRLRGEPAGLLALPNKPTFQDHLMVLHPSILALKRDEAYGKCFPM
jgi:hypothetical protein